MNPIKNFPVLPLKTSFRSIQVVLGITFCVHGFKKLYAGSSQWQFLGEQLQLFGIDVFPIFFGLLASLSEFLGGLLLVSGYYVRIASFFLMGTMAVALVFMIVQTGDFGQYAYPLTNLLLLLIFFLSPSKTIKPS